MITEEQLLDFINKVNWLIDECETNEMFGMDGQEEKCLKTVKKSVSKIETLLMGESNA